MHDCDQVCLLFVELSCLCDNHDSIAVTAVDDDIDDDDNDDGSD